MQCDAMQCTALNRFWYFNVSVKWAKVLCALKVN